MTALIVCFVFSFFSFCLSIISMMNGDKNNVAYIVCLLSLLLVVGAAYKLIGA